MKAVTITATAIALADADADDHVVGCRTEVIDLEPGLAPLQAAVGGYIEAIYPLPGVVMFLNEEGKIQGLPHNPVASLVAAEVLYGDYICGNVVLVGEDGHGESVGLTDEQVEAIYARLDAR